MKNNQPNAEIIFILFQNRAGNEDLQITYRQPNFPQALKRKARETK